MRVPLLAIKFQYYRSPFTLLNFDIIAHRILC